jgi:hypothetical protein
MGDRLPQVGVATRARVHRPDDLRRPALRHQLRGSLEVLADRALVVFDLFHRDLPTVSSPRTLPLQRSGIQTFFQIGRNSGIQSKEDRFEWM